MGRVTATDEPASQPSRAEWWWPLALAALALLADRRFAVIPLVQFVSDRKKMGVFAIPRAVAVLAWIVAGIIVALNIKLLAVAVLGP